MYFSYSPQRSSSTRIDYLFEPSKHRIIIAHRIGKEVTERVEGNYVVIFQEESCEKYILNLKSVNDFKSLPGRLLRECKVVDQDFHVKLLKPYGPEEEHDLSIRFPGWNKVDSDIDEYKTSRITSLNEFQQLTLLWMNQISEIKCQAYNLLCSLDNEYKALNTEVPPFPSPISIRTLKTSILNNVILYVEAIANFLSAISLNINYGIYGSPEIKTSLDQDAIDKLTEANGKYIRLEDKLVFSAECLSNLMGSDISIDKGNHNWGRFKEFKTKRDSITHIKILDNSPQNVPSLDYMIASIQISDSDLVVSAELICWFNSLLNEVACVVGSELFPNFHNFNDHIVGFFVNLASSVSGISNHKIIQKCNIERVC